MNRRIIFRLSDSLYEKAQQAIQEEKADNLSELLRRALKQFLDEEVGIDG